MELSYCATDSEDEDLLVRSPQKSRSSLNSKKSFTQKGNSKHNNVKNCKNNSIKTDGDGSGLRDSSNCKNLLKSAESNCESLKDKINPFLSDDIQILDNAMIMHDTLSVNKDENTEEMNERFTFIKVNPIGNVKKTKSQAAGRLSINNSKNSDTNIQESISATCSHEGGNSKRDLSFEKASFSQKVLKNPRKFATSNTKVRNDLQELKVKKSPSKRLSKFSPIRQIKQRSIDSYFRKSSSRKCLFPDKSSAANKLSISQDVCNHILGISVNNAIGIKKISSLENISELNTEVNQVEIVTIVDEDHQSDNVVFKNSDLHLSPSVTTCLGVTNTKVTEESNSIVSLNSDTGNEVGIVNDTMNIKLQLESKGNTTPFNSPKKLSGSSPKSGQDPESVVLSLVHQVVGTSSNDYHIRNFRKIIIQVLQNEYNKILISSDEWQLLRQYFKLTEDCKVLYIRMFCRKFTWHRVSDINYNLPNIPELFDLLEFEEFVTSDYTSDDLGVLLQLVKLPEMKTFCKNLNIPIGKKNKAELIEAFQQLQTKQGSVGGDRSASIRKRLSEILGHRIKLSPGPRDFFTRLLLLANVGSMLLPEELSVSEQIMLQFNIEVGKTVYPSYEIIRQTPIFSSRDHLLWYETAVSYETELIKSKVNKDWDTVNSILKEVKQNFCDLLKNKLLSEEMLKLPLFLRRYSAGSAYAYCLFSGLEGLKKKKEDIPEAISILRELLDQDVYHTYHRGKYFIELALLLHHHMKNPEEAAKIIMEGMISPNVTAINKIVLARRGLLIVNRKSGGLSKAMKKKLLDAIETPSLVIRSTTIKAKSVPSNRPGYKVLYVLKDEVTHDVQYSSVEEFAVAHYKNFGFSKGLHSEGRIIVSLWALLFWDILYEVPIPDVFQSPFQVVPLDLNTNDFYVNRKELIDTRLSEMLQWTDDYLSVLVSSRFEQHEGKMSLVDWKWFRNVTDVVDILCCIGARVLMKLCERLTKEYRYVRKGFPDLMLWSPDERKCKFVEVKGPGDHLSVDQEVWLDYLIKSGGDAEVCFIETTGSRSLKRKHGFTLDY